MSYSKGSNLPYFITVLQLNYIPSFTLRFQSIISVQYKLSQRTTKPTIRLIWPVKTAQSDLITVFADRKCLLQPQGYRKRNKGDPCHTGWMYWLIWDFAGHTGLIVGFVVRLLKYLRRRWLKRHVKLYFPRKKYFKMLSAISKFGALMITSKKHIILTPLNPTFI